MRHNAHDNKRQDEWLHDCGRIPENMEDPWKTLVEAYAKLFETIGHKKNLDILHKMQREGYSNESIGHMCIEYCSQRLKGALDKYGEPVRPETLMNRLRGIKISNIVKAEQGQSIKHEPSTSRQ
ncbi:hypothetical protein [Wolbachia pipientis]|nr:hypothetical protein [Wolbachia pipientis]